METAAAHNAQNGTTTASHTFTPNRASGSTTGQRAKVSWETDKVFTDSGTGLTVEVQRLPLRNPKFSVVVGQTGQNGTSRFVRPAVQVENAKVNVAKTGMTLARLYDEAVLYIEAELQAVEDDFILQKQLREQRAIDRETGKDKVVSTGKTAREAAKRARHENNQVARRAADAELRLKMKGKGK